MVAHPRAATRAHRLRPLSRPMPIRVEADESGEPQALMLGRRRLAVAAVQDRWRIDDEWWRERPVSRLYFSLLLEDGRVVTVYHDLLADQWLQQEYR
jgi:hypothetical protein